MSQYSAQPGAAGTVPVRVQVIDMEPFALNLVVPTYLPAKDLTQRLARDAGLGAYWEDGTRRLFWIRARGRLIGDEEKLEELGIVPHELIHLLPQPPKGSDVAERRPQYPPMKGYAAAGTLNVASALAMILAWTALWSVALTVSHSVLMGVLPSLGLALFTTTFARHLVGGLGSSFKIPILGTLVYVPLVIIAAVPPLFFADDLAALPFAERGIELAWAVGPGLLAGIFGVLLAWLAWYGAVEPLPKQVVEKAQEAAKAMPCHICGGMVEPTVMHQCPYGCGRVFHVGCWNARVAVHSGNSCPVCGYVPGAAAPG